MTKKHKPILLLILISKIYKACKEKSKSINTILIKLIVKPTKYRPSLPKKNIKYLYSELKESLILAYSEISKNS